MRLDQILVNKKLARSRTQSQKMILAGQVSVLVAGKWRVVTKVADQFDESIDAKVEAGEEQRYVSRAGIKLEGALQQFAFDPTDLYCLDVGQSTGGFTDCLLQAGAKKVVGIDVGKTQLAACLRGNSRLVCLEGINARELPVDDLLFHTPAAQGYQLAVMDVSFISQTLILPGLIDVLTPGAHLISLVKPQFEVGPAGVGKGGIVKDEGLFLEVEEKIKAAAEEAGFTIHGFVPSVIEGGDGNREFFLHAQC